MRQIGRSMQMLALALVPVAFVFPRPEVFSFPGPELTWLLAMVVVFSIGRLVEGYAR